MNVALEKLKSTGNLKIIALIAFAVLMLSFFSLILFRFSKPIFTPLYSGLSTEDSTELVAELSKLGVPFKIGDGSSEVMVDASRVLPLRMILAEKGIPKNGSIIGYEVFDKDLGMGTSNFIYNLNYIRALEGELARTIAILSSVKTARVHLVIPKRQIFERNKAEPSASVMVSFRSEKRFVKKDAKAIRHLVSSAVPSLNLNRVTIVDTQGNILARGGFDEYGELTSEDGEEFKQNYELGIKNKITDLVEQIVGIGKVKTQVSVEVTYDKITSSSETFDPESQVARSVQLSEERANSTDGENLPVSVANNLPNQEGDEDAEVESASSNQRTDEITNFEISKTVTNKVSHQGKLTRLSVAVLIDGRYQKDEDTGEEIYIPREEEELAQIRNLVSSAIGFDEERGDDLRVVNLQFSKDLSGLIMQESPFFWLQKDLSNILKTLMIGIVSILIIVLVIRPIVYRAFEFSGKDLDIEQDILQNEAITKIIGNQQEGADSATGEGGVASAEADAEGFNEGGEDQMLDVSSLQANEKQQIIKKANQFVSKNPTQAINILRAWMTSNNTEEVG